MPSTRSREKRLEDLLRGAAGVLETLVSVHAQTCGPMEGCTHPTCRQIEAALETITRELSLSRDEEPACHQALIG